MFPPPHYQWRVLPIVFILFDVVDLFQFFLNNMHTEYIRHRHAYIV